MLRMEDDNDDGEGEGGRRGWKERLSKRENTLGTEKGKNHTGRREENLPSLRPPQRLNIDVSLTVEECL